MACGGCSKRNNTRSVAGMKDKDEVLGPYKYMTDRQIKVRLELYKKRYCQNCENRYKCDITMYVECKKSKK